MYKNQRLSHDVCLPISKAIGSVAFLYGIAPVTVINAVMVRTGSPRHVAGRTRLAPLPVTNRANFNSVWAMSPPDNPRRGDAKSLYPTPPLGECGRKTAILNDACTNSNRLPLNGSKSLLGISSKGYNTLRERVVAKSWQRESAKDTSNICNALLGVVVSDS